MWKPGRAGPEGEQCEIVILLQICLLDLMSERIRLGLLLIQDLGCLREPFKCHVFMLGIGN